MYKKDQHLLTDISQEIISPELVRQLHHCRIETVEELLSVAGALDRQNSELKPALLFDVEPVIEKLRYAYDEDFFHTWFCPGS